MSRKNNNNRHNPNRPNIWGFFQNVLIAAVNKGQLPVMGIVIIFLVISFRIPADEITLLIDKFLSISKFNSILGWILSGFVTLGAFFVTKWQRRIHTKEIRRISDEKTKLQEKLSKQNLPSSNNRNN